MENKANYAVVGAFFTLVVAGLLAFVYWFSTADGTAERTTYNVVFTGAVTGLAAGTDVLFNGIRVGTVSHVGIDPNDPGRVVARIDVDAGAPVMTDTRALLEVQGLTGMAHIQLLGGSAAAGRLVSTPQAPATLVGEPSDFQAILEGARDIVASADSAFSRFDRFLGDNEERVSATIANIEALSAALASFTTDAETGVGVQDLIAQTQGAIEGANAAFARIDGLFADNEERLTATLANVEVFTGALADNADGVQSFLASLSDAGDRIGPLADEFRLLTTDLRTLLDAIPTEQVADTFENVATFTTTLARNTANIDAFFADAGELATNLTGLSEGLQATLDLIDEASTAIDATVIGRAMDNIDRFSVALGDNADNIDAIVVNARTLTETLNTSASRVDEIVARVDTMVATEGGDTLFSEIAEAARAIRVLAEQLDTRTAEITAGISGFTSRGLGGYTALAEEARGTLRRLDRILSNVERNPQMFVFGGGQPVRDFERR